MYVTISSSENGGFESPLAKALFLQQRCSTVVLNGICGRLVSARRAPGSLRDQEDLPHVSARLHEVVRLLCPLERQARVHHGSHAAACDEGPHLPLYRCHDGRLLRQRAAAQPGS